MLDGVISIPLIGQSPTANAPEANEPCGRPRPFVIGPENRLVEVVVNTLSGGLSAAYNPLVLHGPSGSGKSHLVWGLAQLWRNQLRREVAYTTGDDFVRWLTDAQETQAVEEFRSRHRQVDLFVMEHLERIAGRVAAQEELLHTIDSLVQAGRQVLVTAAAAPPEIPGLLSGLTARLVEGLVVPLALPGAEARAEIVRALARARQLELPEAVVRVLAEGLRATAAELQGVVARIDAAGRLEGKATDVELARRYVSEHRGLRPPELSKIAGAAARYFSLRVSELKSPSRRQPVVKARGVAMYLSRLLTYESLESIGRYFGGRDHTTVLHACRKVEGKLAADPGIHEAVKRLEQELARGL